MKYQIIGIRKCGTVALEIYLKSKGHEVIRNPTAFRNPEEIKEGYKLAVILRDPVQRSYSYYNYKKYIARGGGDSINEDFFEALKIHPEIYEDSQYRRTFDKYPYAEVFILEDMRELDDFPVANNQSYIEPLTNSRIDKLRELIYG